MTDEEWIRRHLGELVAKYAGRYVVVAAGEVFVGDDPALLEQRARKKHPGVTPSGLPVPRPSDFSCAL